MNEIEKIQRYIKHTGIEYKRSTPYQMKSGEMLALAQLSGKDTFGAICLAFEYGRAKGERSARAAKKNEKLINFPARKSALTEDSALWLIAICNTCKDTYSLDCQDGEGWKIKVQARTFTDAQALVEQCRQTLGWSADA